MNLKKNLLKLAIFPLLFGVVFLMGDYVSAGSLTVPKYGSGSCPNCARGYMMKSSDLNFQTARSGSATSKASGGDANATYDTSGDPYYLVGRSWITYDTSGLGTILAGQATGTTMTIDSVIWTFSNANVNKDDAGAYNVIVAGQQASSTLLQFSDWTRYGNTVFATFPIVEGLQNVSFNQAGKDAINKYGLTSFATLNDHDFYNIEPEGVNNYGYWTASSTLVVNYTLNAPVIPTSTPTSTPAIPEYITRFETIGGGVIGGGVAVSTSFFQNFWWFILSFFICAGLIGFFSKRLSSYMIRKQKEKEKKEKAKTELQKHLKTSLAKTGEYVTVIKSKTKRSKAEKDFYA